MRRKTKEIAALPPLSLAAWQHNGDLSSREASPVNIDSARILQFFPSSQHGDGSGGSPPRLCGLSGWSATKTAPLSFLSRSSVYCHSQQMCLPKVSLKGILSQRAVGVPSLLPDSTKQQILGIITLDSQQKRHSKCKNKNEKKVAQEKKRACSEQTSESKRCSK